jgi:hypothetical protein
LWLCRINLNQQSHCSSPNLFTVAILSDQRISSGVIKHGGPLGNPELYMVCSWGNHRNNREDIGKAW